MFYSIPNFLTLLRISLVPIFMIFFYYPGTTRYFLVTVIFIVAAITDWLDGYLARKLQQQSSFGAFLDPVADKLIVVVALILLVQLHSTPWLAIPVVIIISREIIISALREWMALIGQRGVVGVNYAGKVKTTVQMVAIIFLLSQPPAKIIGEIYSNKIMMLGYILLYLASLLTVVSMVAYLHAAWSTIRNS